MFITAIILGPQFTNGPDGTFVKVLSIYFGVFAQTMLVRTVLIYTHFDFQKKPLKENQYVSCGHGAFFPLYTEVMEKNIEEHC